MGQKSKRFRAIEEKVDRQQVYSFSEAVALLQQVPAVKFDQSVEVSLKLGVDPRKSDQYVRGTVALPNGTGKSLRILVFTQGEKVTEALDAGATYAGSDELISKVTGGWVDFDAVVASPDMMREVGRLGKVLGPRGLMPTPKAGTVTPDVAGAVRALQGGQIEFKNDKQAVINNAIGKLSFAQEKLVENLRAFLLAVLKAKPAGAKGHYFRSLVISSTMGPGLKLDPRQIETA